MKRVLIFIGLKIAEIVGTGIVLFGCNRLGWLVLRKIIDADDPAYVAIIGYTSTGAIIIFIAYLVLWEAIPAWIKSNWEKAGEIARRGK